MGATRPFQSIRGRFAETAAVRPSRRDIVIATRQGPLATAQSQDVGQRLQAMNPKVQMRLVPLKSEGDKVPDRPLASFGGKGLFTRGIERALLDKRADIAVHSLKDQPTDGTRGLVTVATPTRFPAHDVLIARDASRIEDLPEGATVGTSSPRRKAQLLHVRPDLHVVPLRGNVGTRIDKVFEQKQVDATLLAAAGLLRLGMSEHLDNAVPVDQVLPAASQGALAVQCRVDDHITMRRCMPLNDANTGTLVNTEREVVAALNADCHSPLAVLAEFTEDGQIRLRARVLSHDGRERLHEDHSAPVKRIDDMLRTVIDALLQQGARRLLEQAARDAETSISEP